MQVTRQRILELLREHRVLTVEELAEQLGLTPVTVRHHLDILKSEGLIEVPQVRRRDAPGRPQYTFQLTPAALAYFPKNYQSMTRLMLEEIRENVPPEQMERILGGVALRMAAEASLPGPEASVEERLQAAVRYLNSRGYVAEWQHEQDDTYVLRTHNCPYHEVSHQHSELCSIDLRLVSELLGAQPDRRERLSAGGACCAYVIHAQARDVNVLPDRLPVQSS
jgi:predicted ArsR family transcriptional regulator